MNQSPSAIARRHDLDALRGVAMMLGIVLHGAMSFIPFVGAWAVQDSQAHGIFGLMLAAIHGFRMPLFFLISGFFTAMLWRKRGMRALIWHRFRRIFLPMVLGLITIIPLTGVVSAVAAASRFDNAGGEKADSQVLETLMWGDTQTLKRLIEQGKSVNGKDATGSTPLHAAAFFGKADAVRLLLEAGADFDATNADGRRADEILNTPWVITESIAKMFNVQVNQQDVEEGRKKVAELLAAARTGDLQNVDASASSEMPSDVTESSDALDTDGAEVFAEEEEDAKPDDKHTGVASLVGFLKHVPILGHLWFLWFLCWMVVGFAVVASSLKSFGLRKLPNWATVSLWRYAWLIPLAAISQFMMDEPSFGPDTSITLWPNLTVLLYYSVFFGFGALYYEAEDHEGKVGRNWWVAIALGLFIAFPVGLATMFQEELFFRVLSAFAQASYAWLLTFGSMGLFRKFFSDNNPGMRYLSDSSYWLYLAHIPLVIALQAVVSDWKLIAPLKFLLVCVVTTAILLASYQLFVRYTPIGTLLNGPRKRPGKVFATQTAD